MAVKTRSTRQKRLILSILEQSAGPLTPAEIYRMARKEQPNLAISTVYRNLETAKAFTAPRGNIPTGII